MLVELPRTARHVCAALLAAAPVPAWAQSESDEAILVVARIDDPAQGPAAGVRTLARDDLVAQAPVSLVENLALLPGIDAFEKGGPGGGSYLALRGGEPNFTLVTINGVRVNDPLVSSGGGFDFTLVGPHDAARIDVLSGPWSTAYGADALSGVVSIRLDPPREASRTSARLGVGTGGRFDLGGRASVSGKAGAMTVSAGARDTGDLFEGARNRGESAMVSMRPALGASAGLDLFGYYAASRGSGFPEDSGGPEFAVIREAETRRREQIALGAAFHADLAPALIAQVRAGWGRSRLESDSPGIAPGILDGVPPISSDSRFERLETVATLDWSPDRRVSLGLGASFVHENGVSAGEVDFGFPIPTDYALSRSLPGFFATAALALPAGIDVRGGIRADFPEEGGARITPRAGLAVPLGKTGLRFTANYAQGFKQPSLFALGFPLIANPDLKPERSTTLDAGLQWLSPDRDWQAGVTAFRSVYRDLIDFDPERFTNVNRNRVRSQGIEFGGSGGLGDLRLLASLTYLDVRSQDGAKLRFRPKWKGAAAVEWRASQDLSFRLDGRMSGSFLDSSIPTGLTRLDGFATFDAQASLTLLQGVVLTATLRNLGNERYERTAGTPEPGRAAFVSLTGSL